LTICSSAIAGSRNKPPKPLNKDVIFEAYKDTDIAQVKYFKSRREFRVGHTPYKFIRFHVAEYILIREHTLKYLRPDLLAEIKMAPRHNQPELMDNKVFQAKWKEVIDTYQKTVSTFEKIRLPRQTKESAKIYLAAMQGEIFLAQKVSQHLFPSQKKTAFEQLRDVLAEKFRKPDDPAFDDLFSEFEKTKDLSSFYPEFVAKFIKPQLDKANQLAEKAMAEVGLEYAIAAEEKNDFIE
jgi:hypothetical protein